MPTPRHHLARRIVRYALLTVAHVAALIAGYMAVNVLYGIIHSL